MHYRARQRHRVVTGCFVAAVAVDGVRFVASNSHVRSPEQRLRGFPAPQPGRSALPGQLRDGRRATELAPAPHRAGHAFNRVAADATLRVALALKAGLRDRLQLAEPVRDIEGGRMIRPGARATKYERHGSFLPCEGFQGRGACQTPAGQLAFAPRPPRLRFTFKAWFNTRSPSARDRFAIRASVLSAQPRSSSFEKAVSRGLRMPSCLRCSGSSSSRLMVAGMGCLPDGAGAGRSRRVKRAAYTASSTCVSSLLSGLGSSNPTCVSSHPCSACVRDGSKVKVPLRVSVKALNRLQAVRGWKSACRG